MLLFQLNLTASDAQAPVVVTPAAVPGESGGSSHSIAQAHLAAEAFIEQQNQIAIRMILAMVETGEFACH